ncbi:MAG: hypothetical protein Q7R99_00095 [bacterium]|nr:hypothetical protein [bacterium]
MEREQEQKFITNQEEGEDEENKEKDSLADVERIHESRSCIIKTKEEINRYVEKPLVEACEMLWDKGIRTLESSADKQDFEARGYGYIVVAYDSLSDENKKIVDESEDIDGLSDYDSWTKAFDLKIPLESEDVKQEEVSQKALELVSRFQSQPAFWVPKFSLAELKSIYAFEPDEEVDPASFIEEEKYYYDEGEDKFYLSEEHYKLFHQNEEAEN